MAIKNVKAREILPFKDGELITKAKLEAHKAELGYSPGDSTQVTGHLDALAGVRVPKNYQALRAKLMQNQPARRDSSDIFTRMSPENRNALVLAAMPDKLCLKYRAPKAAAANSPKAWADLLKRIVGDIHTNRLELRGAEPYGLADVIRAAERFVKNPGSPVEAAKLRHDCIYQLGMVLVELDAQERGIR